MNSFFYLWTFQTYLFQKSLSLIPSLELSYWLPWWWVLIWFVIFVCELIFRAFSSVGIQCKLDGGSLRMGQFDFCLCQIHMVSLVSWVPAVGWCEFRPHTHTQVQFGVWFLMGAFLLSMVHDERPSLQRRLPLLGFWLYVPLPAFCCVQDLRFQLLCLEMGMWTCPCWFPTSFLGPEDFFCLLRYLLKKNVKVFILSNISVCLKQEEELIASIIFLSTLFSVCRYIL